MNYYQILGVPQNANLDEIKRAYRRLALKWHPDKNTDKVLSERKFKEISEAYQVLSDENKRAAYDRFGKQGLAQGSRARGSYHGHPGGYPSGHATPHFHFVFRDPRDLFKEFFGGNLFDLFMSPAQRNQAIRSTRWTEGPLWNIENLLTSGSTGGYSERFTRTVTGSGIDTSTSVSTRIIDGKKVETIRVTENGGETVKVYENGVLTSLIINGVPQAIEYSEKKV